MRKNRSSYDVVAYNKKGKALFNGAKLRVWKKYFNRGGYENAVNLLTQVQQDVDSMTSQTREEQYSNCQGMDSSYDGQEPARQRGGVCKHFDKFVQAGVPKDPLRQALTFYKKNKSKFKKRRISIADYSSHSKKKRFFIVDLDSGKVTRHKVSHGSGYEKSSKIKYGDRNHDGMIDRCQAPSGSRTNMSRPGFF